MASTTVKDSTFRSYSAEQAKIYATHRLSYEAAIYDTVLSHHASAGGQFGLLLDVGCGPGNATRDVALSFDQAIGVDPGPSMIATAREIGGKTKSGEGIRYEVSGAEEISGVKGLEGESVDLLISAMAVSDSVMEGVEGKRLIFGRRIGLRWINFGWKLRRWSSLGELLPCGLAVSLRNPHC
jgi:trans-aconitate 3-methyltransferase